MDPFSQGLLGAGVAQSFSKKETIRIAAICGVIGGMAPDLDIFIRSDNDPLLFIEYHRHFTHALAFVPFGSAIISLLLWLLFFKKKTTLLFVYIFTTLGFATHGLLDASTSYGTRLFWPFSDMRVSWNIISIIDPIFTLTLLVFCLLSLIRRSPFLIKVGTGLALSYLLFGTFKHAQIESFIRNVAAERNHTIERLLLNPTIGNTILWRSVYQSNGYYYIDAVYAPVLTTPILHPGKAVKAIDKHTIFPELGANSVQRSDIKRFAYFSQDFIYVHPDDPFMIADLRYGTLPYDDYSLWGIKVDIKNPDAHVSFGNLRNMNDKHYDEFWLMLNGTFPEKKTFSR